MATTVGSGNLQFEPVENWEKLPPGWEFIDVAGGFCVPDAIRALGDGIIGLHRILPGVRAADYRLGCRPREMCYPSKIHQI